MTINIDQLTEQQALCVRAATTKQNLKIKAFAGTGKTSTLNAISQKLTGNGLYLAFNKSVQLSAKDKFPGHVDCRTAHSLAYAEYKSILTGRIKTLSITQAVESLNLNSPYEDCDNLSLAFMIIKLLRTFCYSTATSIDTSFAGNAIFNIVRATYVEHSSIINYVITKANLYWELMWASESSLPIEHDFYLKYYQLSNPDLSSVYDFILFDECQDANPVLIDIVTKQSCQKIFVGDQHQQIYSWRGAVNAFGKVDALALSLSLSFRFSDQIAQIANSILICKGESKLLRGLESKSTSITPQKPHCYTMLSRTNAKIIESILDLKNKPIYVPPSVYFELLSLAESGFALYSGQNEDVTHIKIKQFKSWDSMIDFNDTFQDSDISILAMFIGKYKNSFPDIIEQIKNANYVEEKQAEVVLSTIHKAKGMEWDNVVIDSDFHILDMEIKQILAQEEEELNLLYVAITRAKEKLHMTRPVLAFINRLSAYGKAKNKKQQYG